jgi:chromosome segregation ATPase
MVDSMDSATAEVDRLAAENASLTYDLGVKSAENEEHLISLKSLQQKLDSANSKLLEMEQTVNDGDGPEMLKTKLSSLQNEYASLEQSKLDLESALEAKSTSMSDLQAQVDILHARASLAEQLQGQINELEDTISTKDNELKEMAVANEQLKSQMVSCSNDEQLAESREELSTLQSQFDEFRQHHNITTGYMEEQLSSLMQQKSMFDAQLEECKNEIDRIQRENSELSAALNVARSCSDTELSRDKLRLQELENERTQLRDMLNQQQNGFNDQRQTFDDLSHKYEEMRSEFERVQVSLARSSIFPSITHSYNKKWLS